MENGVALGLHIAPMMGRSHLHGRRLWRMLCPGAVLYTEMTAAAAVARAGEDARRRLLFLPLSQKPAVLQLAGDDAQTMRAAAALAAECGYDALNINCGCPSERAQRGGFGARLMTQPLRAAAVVRAARAGGGLPVSVKCRTAVDDADAESFLSEFVAAVADAGAGALIVHARRALLAGLSPAQNRSAPPLDLQTAEIVRARFPGLPMIINGGIATAENARELLSRFEGVMVGRAAARNPWLLAEIARREFGARPPSRMEALRGMLEYAVSQPPGEWRKIAAAAGGLFYGMPGGGELRRTLARARGVSDFILSAGFPPPTPPIKDGGGCLQQIKMGGGYCENVFEGGAGFGIFAACAV